MGGGGGGAKESLICYVELNIGVADQFPLLPLH